jgi:hypothetical protein
MRVNCHVQRRTGSTAGGREVLCTDRIALDPVRSVRPDEDVKNDLSGHFLHVSVTPTGLALRAQFDAAGPDTVSNIDYPELRATKHGQSSATTAKNI